MTGPITLIVWLLIGAAPGGADALIHGSADGADPCTLISVEEMGDVQQTTVTDRKPTTERAKSLRIEHCYFASSAPARAVSLSVIRADADAPSAARDYWMRTFHPAPKPVVATPRPPRKKDPARPIDDVGEEAFWIGDQRAGTLYVWSHGVVLRISVGGVADPEERIRRSRTLAVAALKRLR